MALPMAKTGSVMMCDKGTAPIPLVASGSAKVEICDVFLAAVSDVKPGANISPFGICIITQSVCSPMPVGLWKNPFDSACIVGGVQGLLENAKLPCAIGGTISLMSAGQASVLVGQNVAELATTGYRIAGWALDAWGSTLGYDFGPFEIPCNQFVAAAFAAAGIPLPKLKRNRMGVDIFAKDSLPTVQELVDPRRFNDILTPPKPIGEAEVGDMILWHNAEHNHSAILTGKTGPNPDNWHVVYTSGSGEIVKRNTVKAVTDYFKGTVPVARGHRKH